MRRRILSFLDSSAGRNTVLALIVANAVLLGLETYPTVAERWGGTLHAMDRLILWAFTVELLARFYGVGNTGKYLRDPWNLFDLVVVGACWMPAAGGYISVVRLLRVLRVLRAMSVLPELRVIVGSLLRSLPGMAHIALLLVLVIYTYSVLGTFIFREASPEHFGSLHRTALTMFEVVTLEGWVDVMKTLAPTHPWAWAYFVSFIFVGTFVVFNLFVGVIVSNIERSHADEPDPDAAFRKRVLAELASLRKANRRKR